MKATTDGVVRAPSALGMTRGSAPSITATQEFVVPRSMPMTRLKDPAGSYVSAPLSSLSSRSISLAPLLVSGTGDGGAMATTTDAGRSKRSPTL
jgi:hypothetical protein